MLKTHGGVKRLRTSLHVLQAFTSRVAEAGILLKVRCWVPA